MNFLHAGQIAGPERDERSNSQSRERYSKSSSAQGEQPKFTAWVGDQTRRLLLRDGSPRPLDSSELCQCATCPRWEPRTFDATKRDIVFETWGVGIPVPEHRAFDDVKRDLVMEAWGV